MAFYVNRNACQFKPYLVKPVDEFGKYMYSDCSVK